MPGSGVYINNAHMGLLKECKVCNDNLGYGELLCLAFPKQWSMALYDKEKPSDLI